MSNIDDGPFSIPHEGLFEIVQTVATQLGQYSYSLPNGPSISFYGGFSKNDLGNNRRYIFQREGLKAVIEFPDNVERNWLCDYFVKLNVFVEVNGKKVFQEVRDFDTYEGYSSNYRETILKTYKPGDWETKLQELYKQALHLKAGREARRDALRQRMRSVNNRRSASFW